MRYINLVLPALLLFAGCTYSFRGQTAGAIKTIAIPTFTNESAEFGLGERVTDELVRAFQRDGTLRIQREDIADAILRGRIMRAEDQPYTASANQQVEEYRFLMTCEVELVSAQSGERIWIQVFPEYAVYPYTGSLEFRDQAIEETVSKLQQDLVNRIVGSW